MVIILSTMAAVSVAQPPAIPDSGVRGFISNGEGNPVTAARVTITPRGESTGATIDVNNPSGSYDSWTAPGDYDVRVEADGYVPANASVHVPDHTWITQNFSIQRGGVEPENRVSPPGAPAAKVVEVPAGIALVALVVIAVSMRPRRPA